MQKGSILARPNTILTVFVLINVMNYLDRFIFSALLPAIKADLGFSDYQLGLLGSAFIFAYLLMAPLFGRLGDTRARHPVMAAGIAVWSVATAFSGTSRTFLTQLMTRITVGAGEAGFTVIAPSVLADAYPAERRGWIYGVYNSAIPVGSALGFILGGILVARVGWQNSFYVVGGPGLLLAGVLLFLKDPGHKTHEVKPKFGEAYQVLIKNRAFIATVLGYTAHTFVVGGMAFWMPTYLVRYFSVSLERGNLVFGGVTVMGGFIGTLLGGWWADRWNARSGKGYLKVAAASMFVAVPLLWVALKAGDFTTFIALLFVTEIALFLCISPLDTAVINSVPKAMRSTAMSVSIFTIHFLGDGLSRALMGAISDAEGLQKAIGIGPVILGFAGVLWILGLRFSSRETAHQGPLRHLD